MVTLLIRKLKLQRVLVFTHSTESVHRFKIEGWIKHWPFDHWCFSSGLRLALLLANLGHATGELHSLVKRRRKVGFMSKASSPSCHFATCKHLPYQVLNQLEAGNLQLVVCSDALARGIDVNDLDGVISYDAPTHLKTWDSKKRFVLSNMFSKVCPPSW